MDQKFSKLRFSEFAKGAATATIIGALSLQPVTANAATGGKTITAGNAVWFLNTGITFSTTSSNWGFSEASLHTASGTRNDAFDGALSWLVSTGTPNPANGYRSPGGVVDISPSYPTNSAVATTVTGTTQVLAGLNVSGQIYFPVDKAVARSILNLQNPSGAPITVTVESATNRGSDSNTFTQLTSSGDQTFDSTDNWFVSSETATPTTINDPVLTFAYQQTGAAVRGTPNPTPVNGQDRFYEFYTLTIPAGETRSLMAFVQMSATVAGAETDATVFNSNVSLQASGFLSGLSAAQQSAIVNWSLFPVPTTNDVTASVAYDSTNDPITLDIGGGTAASVAVATPPSNGTATASGLNITYTPNAGFSGTDTFTYTATNLGGTSVPATATITVGAASVTVSPTTLPDATQGTAYSQTLVASGGQAPYTFSTTPASGSLPPGLTLSSAGVISGAPTATGTFTFTAAGSDSGSGTPASFTSGSLAITVVLAVPAANAVSTSVPYNSSNDPVTLAITGTASSVAITTPPAHGTATVSGLNIIYTPNAAFAGVDTFAYTASNSSGTSAPATISITVGAPTVTVGPPALPAAIQGTAYSQSLTATGGQSPYTFSLTLAGGSLPPGLTLSSAGVISGTPSAAGSFTFEASGVDSTTGTPATFTSGPITLVVAVQAPTANVVTTSVLFGSSNDPIALNISGTATSVAITTAPANGTAIVSGLSILYTPNARFSGVDTLAYSASNASGTSAPAIVSITVSAAPVPLSAPTLSTWAFVLFTSFIAMIGSWVRRRRD